VDHPVFDHEGPWTEDAYLALPHDVLPRDGRVELVEGTLIIGPGTSADRARVVSRIRAALEEVLPDGLRVIGPVPLRLGPDCMLVPDLVVTRAPDGSADGPASDGLLLEATEPTSERHALRSTGSGAHGPELLDAADALMVVEVVGREHGVTDRSFKPQLYARGRIPYSLLVDHHGPFAVADMIIGGRYHEYARAAAGEALSVEEPFLIEIDLAALVRADTTTHGSDTAGTGPHGRDATRGTSTTDIGATGAVVDDTAAPAAP